MNTENTDYFLKKSVESVKSVYNSLIVDCRVILPLHKFYKYYDQHKHSRRLARLAVCLKENLLSLNQVWKIGVRRGGTFPQYAQHLGVD